MLNLLENKIELKNCYFRKKKEKVYKNFIEITNLVDLSAIDYNSLCFSSKILILSLIYVKTGCNFNILNKQNANLEKQSIEIEKFNEIFDIFLIKFNEKTENLFKCIEYWIPLFNFKDFCYKFPSINVLEVKFSLIVFY